MAISNILSRRVRVRRDDDEEEEVDLSNVSGSEEDGSEDGEEFDETDDNELHDDGSSDDQSDMGSNAAETDGSEPDEEEAEEDEDEDDGETDIQASISNISFGALAKAQASLGPRSKRSLKQSSKATTEDTSTSSKPSTLDDIRARIRSVREQKQAKEEKQPDQTPKKDKKVSSLPTRTSKHAPTVQSSKRAVSRKRTVIEPSSNVAKPRDPRFDPSVTSTTKPRSKSGFASYDDSKAQKAYSFLDTYRQSELTSLKSQLVKTKDPHQKELLQKAIRSMTDRMRSIEHKKREREILAEHKAREKQLLKEGKKKGAYFLKRSEVKEKVLVRRFEEMGDRERKKAVERRRRKVVGRERKGMPFERRGVSISGGATSDGGGGGGDALSGPSGESRKRRRGE